MQRRHLHELPKTAGSGSLSTCNLQPAVPELLVKIAELDPWAFAIAALAFFILSIALLSFSSRDLVPLFHTSPSTAPSTSWHQSPQSCQHSRRATMSSSSARVRSQRRAHMLSVIFSFSTQIDELLLT